MKRRYAEIPIQTHACRQKLAALMSYNDLCHCPTMWYMKFPPQLNDFLAQARLAYHYDIMCALGDESR
jgi:hypothetical protein